MAALDRFHCSTTVRTYTVTVLHTCPVCVCKVVALLSPHRT